jgi:nicotinate-nucleotide adenylyltransferase
MTINNLVDEYFIVNQEKIKKFENQSNNIKIGIMGGTFDPIHCAHLAIAEFIRDNYKLDKILFIPSGNPPHKNQDITDKYDRYNMVLMAIRNNDDFIGLDIEIQNDCKTYTVDTLKRLKKEYSNCDIFFITGADAICDIESWKDVEQNFKLATFIAATRPGISLIQSQEKIEYLQEKYNAKIMNTNEIAKFPVFPTKVLLKPKSFALKLSINPRIFELKLSMFKSFIFKNCPISVNFSIKKFVS